MTPKYPTARKTLSLLHAFLRGDTYTVGEALGGLGIYALSQECGRLRRLGWPVDDEWEKTPNGEHVKRYSLLRVNYG